MYIRKEGDDMRIFAKKVDADGYKFDSEMEYSYYLILKDRLAKGEIKDLKIHPLFLLIPEFEKDGKKWRPMNYEADFQFIEVGTNKERIIDVKGMVLPEFEIHRKMFEYLYPSLHLEVLKHSKTTGWVELDSYKQTMRSKRQQIKQERTELRNRLARIAWLNHRINELDSLTEPSKAQMERKSRYEEELQQIIGSET
jgi:hypothetical protein